MDKGFHGLGLAADFQARQHALPGVGDKGCEVGAVFVGGQFACLLRLLETALQDQGGLVQNRFDLLADGGQQLAHFKAQAANKAVVFEAFLLAEVRQQLAVIGQNSCPRA